MQRGTQKWVQVYMRTPVCVHAWQREGGVRNKEITTHQKKQERHKAETGKEWKSLMEPRSGKRCRSGKKRTTVWEGIGEPYCRKRETSMWSGSRTCKPHCSWCCRNIRLSLKERSDSLTLGGERTLRQSASYSPADCHRCHSQALPACLHQEVPPP